MVMEKKGLTLTFIMMAESANYSDGLNNISVLKKMNRGDSNQYSYISRQALRYNMIQQLGWDTTPVERQKKVVQFHPDATIKDYPEIDLFGYTL
jgi:CRISPR-associated protein Cst2